MEVHSSILEHCVGEREGKLVRMDFQQYYGMMQLVDVVVDGAKEQIEEEKKAKAHSSHNSD